jgi:hypothetical protein
MDRIERVSWCLGGSEGFRSWMCLGRTFVASLCGLVVSFDNHGVSLSFVGGFGVRDVSEFFWVGSGVLV